MEKTLIEKIIYAVGVVVIALFILVGIGYTVYQIGENIERMKGSGFTALALLGVFAEVKLLSRKQLPDMGTTNH